MRRAAIEILAFDPSSTRLGFARVRLDPDATPADTTSPIRWGNLPLWGEDAFDRVRDAGDAARAILAEERARPAAYIVVETPGARPAGKHATPARHMAIYGAAVGAVLAACWAEDMPVRTVAADVWTRLGGRGGVRKEARLAMLPRLDVGSTYAAEMDPGGDGGDALMLGWWSIRREWRPDGRDTAGESKDVRVGNAGDNSVACARLVAVNARWRRVLVPRADPTDPTPVRKRQQPRASDTQATGSVATESVRKLRTIRYLW